MKEFYYNYFTPITEFYDFNYKVIISRFERTYIQNIDNVWFKHIFIEHMLMLEEIALKRHYNMGLVDIWWYFKIFYIIPVKFFWTIVYKLLFFFYYIKNIIRNIIVVMLIENFFYYLIRISRILFSQFFKFVCIYYLIFFLFKKILFVFIKIYSLIEHIFDYLYLSVFHFFTYLAFFLFTYKKKIINSILFKDWEGLYSKVFAHKVKAPDIDVYVGIPFSTLSIFIRKSGITLLMVFIKVILIINTSFFFPCNLIFFEVGCMVQIIYLIKSFSFGSEKLYRIIYTYWGWIFIQRYCKIYTILDFYIFNLKLRKNYILFRLKYHFYYYFLFSYFIFLISFFILLMHIVLILLHNNLIKLTYAKYKYKRVLKKIDKLQKFLLNYKPD